MDHKIRQSTDRCSRLLHNWPTSGALVGQQTPSEIAYPPNDTTNFSWGYDIDPRVKRVGLNALSLGAATGLTGSSVD